MGIKSIEQRNSQISLRLRQELSKVDDIHLLDYGSKLGNIVTFYKEGVTENDSAQFLHKNEVMCGIAQKFSALIDFKNKERNWAIRFSPHYFNTNDEIDRVVDIVNAM